MFAAFFSLWFAAAHTPILANIVGTWAWHDTWQSAPAEVVEDSGPEWSAPGVVLSFCADGHFRMAAGVIYRAHGTTALGSSDGLQLFEGKWFERDGLITVEYRLVDAEISFTGMDEALKKTETVWPQLVGTTINFEYRSPGSNTSTLLIFHSADSFEDHIAPRFVECSEPTR